MKDPNGFYVDISQTDSDMLSMDSMASIRMNVDNFAEAYEILKDSDVDNAVGFMISAIKKGYEKQVKSTKKNGFNDFKQRKYDFKELEKDAINQ